MIINHQYLTQDFLNNKSIAIVNKDNPLVLLLSNTFTFFNDFIVYCLKANKVYF